MEIGKREFIDLKPVVAANLALMDGKITESEHALRIQALNSPELP